MLAASLQLRIDVASISENGGLATGQVTRLMADDSEPLDVLLFSSDTSEATVPALVEIAAGQASSTFTVTGVDDDLLDGRRRVFITASAAGYREAPAELHVTDYETITISLDPSSISENGGVATATVTRHNSDIAQPLELRVAANDSSESVVPATITIPAGQASTTFAVNGVDDDLLDGRQAVEISIAESHSIPAAIDTAFGAGGFITPLASLDWRDTSGRLARLPDGGFLLATNVSDTILGSFLKLVSLSRYLPDGQLDTSFGDQGLVLASVSGNASHSVHGLIVQPDGRILLSVEAGFGNLLRFLPDGSPDTGFGGIGGVGSRSLTHAPYHVGLQRDGRIVVAYGDDSAIRVERFLPDGARDFSFGVDGVVSIPVGSRPSGGFSAVLAVQPDDRITVAAGNDAGLLVARLLADGSSDASFNGGQQLVAFPEVPASFDEFAARQVLVDDAGRTVVVGHSDDDIGTASGALLVARLTNAGALDASFNIDGRDALVGDFAVGAGRLQPDGRLLIGAGDRSGTSGGGLLVRYRTDGTLDADFGTGGLLGLSSIHREFIRDVAFTATGDLLTLAGESAPEVHVGRVGLFDDRYASVPPATLDVADDERLTVEIDLVSIPEQGGVATGTVTRGNTDRSLPLTIALTSDDTTEAIVPATVEIPAGAASVAFVITAVDDDLLDASRVVTITAKAAGYVDGSEQLNIEDVERLVVTIADAAISEHAGATTAVVTRTDPTGDLLVMLASGDTGEATVLGSVTIAAGQTTSPPVAITAVDDLLLDGTQTVTISVSAAGYIAAGATLNVTDYEPLVLAIADAEISENGGATTAVVTRTDPRGELTVLLSSDDPTAANVVNSIVIPDGATTSPAFEILAADDVLPDGTQSVIITASAAGYIDAADALNVTDFEPLTLTIEANAISENGGSTSTVVTRTGSSGDLLILLAVDDASAATIDASVLIPHGQSMSPPVVIEAVDNALLDGSRVVTITASALGYVDGSESLSVEDFEPLTVTLADAVIPENGGATLATVTRSNTDRGAPLTVVVQASDPSEAVVGEPVIIPAGKASATFPVTAVDDAVLDGTQIVEVTATAEGYTSVAGSLNVTDHEPLALMLVDGSISEAGGVATAFVTRTDATDSVTITLVSSEPTAATIAASVYLPRGQTTSPPIAVAAVDDLLVDGTQTTTLTASADGYVDAMAELSVSDFEPLALTIDDDAISEQGGITWATVTRTDPRGDLTVLLSSNDPTAATVPAKVVIRAGQTSATFMVTAVDDDRLDGTQSVTITAAATGYEAAAASVDVSDFERLSVTLDNDAISENGGATTATVSRTDPDGSLTVFLGSSDDTAATVPESVVIADGEYTATFPVAAVDDLLVDGTQLTTIVAVGVDYLAGYATLAVSDFEPLALMLAQGAISRNGGATTATVSRTDPTHSLTVSLDSSDAAVATVPTSLVIPAGETSATFLVSAADADPLDGTQSVMLTASAAGYVSARAELTVFDDGPPWQNPRDPFDVNDNGHVNPQDALVGINELNRNGPRLLPPPDEVFGAPPFYDVNGDDMLTAADVLQVINHLNGEDVGESEAARAALFHSPPLPHPPPQSHGASQPAAAATFPWRGETDRDQQSPFHAAARRARTWHTRVPGVTAAELTDLDDIINALAAESLRIATRIRPGGAETCFQPRIGESK